MSGSVNSWVSARNFNGASETFLLLGPFAAGSVVERWGVHISVLGTTSSDRLTLAASLGASGEATQEALDAGSPVVQRGAVRIGRTPGMTFDLEPSGEIRIIVPVGVLVGAGSRYMVVGFIQSEVTVVSRLTTWAEVGQGRGRPASVGS